MLSLRNFWRRHRSKILITAGVLGSGYFLYRLYNAREQRLADMERELARQRANDELIKAQLQVHFENVQLIADTTTLPHAMQYLRSRIAEELDLSQLTERLQKGKGKPYTLTSSEKLELWDRLKILSFTQMVVSLWAVTILSLYIKVQVNILGRHLYIDTARGLGSSLLLENVDLIDRDDQQKFLAGADFLANNGLLALISNIQAVVTEVIEGKKLIDLFNTTSFHETVMQILDKFMSVGSLHQWIDYLMPEDRGHYKLGTSSSIDDTVLPNSTNFDQLMVEARTVLSSAEFGKIMGISLKVAVDALVEDMEAQCQSTGASLTSGMPLAKLLSRVMQIVPSLLREASQNQFIQIIRTVPEVELFFTLLYANNLVVVD
ncbi:peroxisome biogenesis protein 3-2 isoform X1 [Populus alba x Populus x berolinensis]|nr:peroxisome biogenesis protein 3-2 isoform X1 [Populus alba x Populus x berolinensis]